MIKKEKLLVLLFFLIAMTGSNRLFVKSSYSMSNDSAGVYLTYEDFKTGKITNGFKPNQKNSTLWPLGFFKNKDIELKTPDTSKVYKRDSIWGYSDHKGRLIRVFNKRHYNVLSDKGLIIYIIYSKTKTSYHFSKTLYAPVYRLTKKNLATVYADNPDLLQKINSIKKKHWLNWDDKKEVFLLNELYAKN